MSGFSHAYWYPDSSLAYSTKLVNRSLCLQDDRQIILVGSATHLEKNLKVRKNLCCYRLKSDYHFILA